MKGLWLGIQVCNWLGSLAAAEITRCLVQPVNKVVFPLGEVKIVKKDCLWKGGAFIMDVGVWLWSNKTKNRKYCEKDQTPTV